MRMSYQELQNLRDENRDKIKQMNFQEFCYFLKEHNLPIILDDLKRFFYEYNRPLGYINYINLKGHRMKEYGHIGTQTIEEALKCQK